MGRPTEKMVEIIRKRKLAVPATFEEASALIDEIAKKERWGNKKSGPGSAPKNGPISAAQKKVLEKYGYDTVGVTKAAASRIIDGIANNGWKRPEFDEEPEVEEEDDKIPFPSRK